ncbi:MAG: YjbH domain-containing protein, partial [Verrucomicrobia bacterium]|nr:YjbH domain-containing protein [Verrucomicrobiota bacterium]
TPSEDLPFFPLISVGAQDFIGTKRFNAQYVVATQTFANNCLELSLGWGHGRIKGFFGGLTWAPFHHKKTFFKDLALQAEYDANDYKKYPHEHPNGRKVKSPINAGISLTAFDYFGLSVSALRGEKVAVAGSFRYPLGSTKGFFPKVDDPKNYKAPVDTEPLGPIRPEEDFTHELAYAFSDQGLELYRAHLEIKSGKKELWLTVVNNRYRDHFNVKERIQNILAALTPSNIDSVTVVIEATALPCQSYHFNVEDLYRYRQGLLGPFELQTLSPMKEALPLPNDYESILLFKRSKPIWTFTLRPRFISFFGNTNGKFKCNLSATASPEGYLFSDYYYKTLLSYSVYSNTKGMSGVDRLNPSHMFVVRSDSMKYYQTNTVHLEQAFVQRSLNLRKGFFFRLAGGYFETAYAGAATEFLYYPVNSPFAIGIECATVWKRKYDGLGFFHKVKKFDGTKTEYFPFIGVQCFLDLYYDYKPLCIDCKITAGRFLAKDLG